ncbi:hypothetical protein HanXRQr2_Chr08g0330661 [Helianthus annuus]|uniref:Uncharacterized protein n=1 Tax=Helianthus annuus TaxID=4232 RepID=A0A251UTQ7_HELAN|nr:hypothetical protein HanXRQr2_Chr08g0330661 [Helianthus annuus]
MCSFYCFVYIALWFHMKIIDKECSNWRLKMLVSGLVKEFEGGWKGENEEYLKN